MAASSELQRKLQDARSRTEAAAASGYLAAPAAAAPAAQAGDADELGPPWHSKAYVVSVMNKDSAFLTKKMISQAFTFYDKDGDGRLCHDEFLALLQGFYSALKLPAPPKRLGKELLSQVPEATDSSPEDLLLGCEELEALWGELIKGVSFKLRIAGAEQQPAGAAAAAERGSPTGRAAVSESSEFPAGAKVEVVSYQKCHAEFEEAARKLRLTEFSAEEGRIPPRSGLTVVGSYRHMGAKRGSVAHGEMVVGVRAEDGQEYLMNARGLRSTLPDKEEPDGEVRARQVAAELGSCSTVRQVLRDFEAARAVDAAEQ